MSRGGPQDLVVAGKENTTSCVSIRAAATYPTRDSQLFHPSFRRLSAASRQEFRSLLHRESAGFQRVFRTFCTRFGHGGTVVLFREFCGGFPNDLADSADEKNGEIAAVVERVWKRTEFSVLSSQFLDFLSSRRLLPPRRTIRRCPRVGAPLRPSVAARRRPCRKRAALLRTRA